MRRLFVIVGLLLSPAIPQAPAQQVMGDGRLLDASLQAGANGRNSPKLTNTFGVYQNALVTGNVAGGRGFRGGVGYRGAGDFSGTLPGDQVYRFQLQSAGRDFQVGARGGPVGYRNPQLGGPDQVSPIYNAPGAGATLGQITGASPVRANLTSSGFRSLDLTQQRLSSTRSDAGFGFQRGNAPSSQLIGGDLLKVPTGPDAIGGANTGGGLAPAGTLDRPVNVDIDPSDNLKGTEGFGPGRAAVSIDGLTNDPQVPERLTGQVQLASPLTSLGERLGNRLVVDAATGIGVARMSPIEAGDINQSLDALLGSTAAEPGVDVYHDLLQKIRTQPAFNPRAGDQLTTPPDADAKAAQPDPDPDGDGPAPTLDELVGKIDYDLAPLRTLAGASETFLSEAMTRAERAMGEERYFDAELNYAQALRHKPGYPLAVVGKVHAQLGAGLFTSAGRTMGVLFKHHPELIAARYTRPLLPSAERLSFVASQLHKLADAKPRAVEPALLLAYIAYQQNDNHACAAALDRLQQADGDDKLLPLLKRIWLNPAPKPAPGAARAEPTEQ